VFSPIGISVEISVVEIEGLESRSGLILGDLVTVHGEMMLRGKRRVLSWRRTRLISCPVKLGRPTNSSSRTCTAKILGVTTKMGCDRYTSTDLGPSII